VLNVTDLENLLASGNVEVTTAGSGVQANVIAVTSAFSWSAADTLTLDAYTSLAIDQPIAVNGPGKVSLVTNDGGSGGTLSFNSGGSLSFAKSASRLVSRLWIDGQPYALIWTLPALANAIAANPSGNFALAADYGADAQDTYRSSPIATTFEGTLNGLGNSISDLKIASSDTYVGLFIELGAGGTIDSLQVTDANISVQSKIETETYTAGVVASASYGTIFNSYASGLVTGVARKDALVYIGGLIGDNAGTILGSAAATDMQAKRGHSIGAAITGGLAEGNSGIIEDSYATGNASVSVGWFDGGLVGFNDGVVENCYSTGNVSVSSSSSYVGGLVGFTYTASIANSYSTGAPSAGSGSYVGGFLGYDASSGGLSDDYWDTTTSGITNLSQGAGYPSDDPGITGLTTSQLQAGLPTGFDPSIWAEDSGINNGLPYLIANLPQ
jgi:hypothetical protein